MTLLEGTSYRTPLLLGFSLCINLINGRLEKYHVYVVLIQDIEELLHQNNVVVCHTLKKGNRCADFFFIKFGVSSDVDLLIHASPQMGCKIFLENWAAVEITLLNMNLLFSTTKRRLNETKLLGLQWQRAHSNDVFEKYWIRFSGGTTLGQCVCLYARAGLVAHR
ncbi:hypothetical protein MTR_4g116580 [Medicago truncatula]|uniref:RNase H type-1 domain-containing protein n=1 Tax=Medicago truncatula TaxID=3880 RepID=G7JHT8_MEDTR|nr:hypothetical protein MTR_4g116580 [Medicago truncatula]